MNTLIVVTTLAVCVLLWIAAQIVGNEVRAKRSAVKRAQMRQRLFHAVRANPVRPAGVYGWTLLLRWRDGV